METKTVVAHEQVDNTQPLQVIGGLHDQRVPDQHGGNESVVRITTVERLSERHHLEAAIAEMVRYQNAGKVLFRYAQEDYNFHGHSIKKGQTLFAPVNAANWDKDVISNPEVFDIHRKQNLSIPFGKGIHFCLGANLARLELASILEQLLDNLPEGSSLDLDNIDWRCDDFIIREITRLVVLVN